MGKSSFAKTRKFWKDRSINGWIVFFFCIYIVIVVKLVTWHNISQDVVFGVYSLAVSALILSKFLLSYFYEPEKGRFDPKYQPTATFAVPSKNEEANIRETIVRIAKSDYPKNKFDIIVINDGSTDGTLREMLAAKAEVESTYGVHVEVIDWKVNKGKREGMAECIRLSNKDLVVFIDSDSFVEKDALQEMAKYFVDPKVGAVAGHAYVANPDTNVLTKMQAIRYFISFKAYKATESLFGSVTCCSGCCAAYRRADVLPFLDKFLNQKFLGVTCTYGDDRSLTNYLLADGKKALFSPTAISYTFVPDTLRQYLKQQMRWKKSWTRESFRAGGFIWKRHPIMSISFYLSLVLPLIAPVILLRALVWYPLTTGLVPYFYLLGLVIMAVVYGLYYYVYTKDRDWMYASLFAVMYSVMLIWQLPWAIINLRDARWGTR